MTVEGDEGNSEDRGNREREKNRTLHPSHHHRMTEEVYLERQMKEGEEDCCENVMEEKRRRVMPMYCQNRVSIFQMESSHKNKGDRVTL